MYQRKEICSCRTSVDNHREYFYRYFLLEGVINIAIKNINVGVPCYGISILREEKVDGNIMSVSEESMKCVSSVRGKVLELISFLRDNEVSPVHLYDVAGEKADEWVSDFDGDAEMIAKSINYN